MSNLNKVTKDIKDELSDLQKSANMDKLNELIEEICYRKGDLESTIPFSSKEGEAKQELEASKQELKDYVQELLDNKDKHHEHILDKIIEVIG